MAPIIGNRRSRIFNSSPSTFVCIVAQSRLELLLNCLSKQYEKGTGREANSKKNGGKTKYDWNSTTCSPLRITYIHVKLCYNIKKVKWRDNQSIKSIYLYHRLQTKVRAFHLKRDWPSAVDFFFRARKKIPSGHLLNLALMTHVSFIHVFTKDKQEQYNHPYTNQYSNPRRIPANCNWNCPT